MLYQLSYVRVSPAKSPRRTALELYLGTLPFRKQYGRCTCHWTRPSTTRGRNGGWEDARPKREREDARPKRKLSVAGDDFCRSVGGWGFGAFAGDRSNDFSHLGVPADKRFLGG